MVSVVDGVEAGWEVGREEGRAGREEAVERESGGGGWGRRRGRSSEGGECGALYLLNEVVQMAEGGTTKGCGYASWVHGDETERVAKKVDRDDVKYGRHKNMPTTRRNRSSTSAIGASVRLVME